MRKTVSVLVTALIILSSAQVFAVTTRTENGMKYQLLSSGMVEITGYNGAQGKKPVIPETINGVKVVSIGAYAFSPKKGNKKIVSIKIPKTVKVIKHDAFKKSSLKSVRIPDSVKKICARAFAAVKIKKISIPSSVKKVGAGVFEKCKNLKKVVIKKGLENIGGSMFFNCKKLKKLIIPNSVKEIGKSAFKNCGLKKIKISKNVKSIHKEAFVSDSENRKLEIIKVNKKNKYFSSRDGVLFNKDKTELIAYPANKGGGPNRGKYYKKLPELTPEQEQARDYIIPKSVKKINKYAFTGTNIYSVVIPGSVGKIGKEVFAGCWDLSEVEIEDGVTSIEKKAFNECYDLVTVSLPKTLKTIEEKAFLYSGVETIHLPQGLKIVKKEAFLGCAFTSIAIPKSVEEIGNKAFGFETGEDGKPGRTNKEFIVKGYKDTKAEQYAKKYNFEFDQLINLPRDKESNFPVWVIITTGALFLGAAAVLLVKVYKRNKRIRRQRK